MNVAVACTVLLAAIGGIVWLIVQKKPLWMIAVPAVSAVAAVVYLALTVLLLGGIQ